jgi:DNA-binding NtrC family response regulator
VDDDASTRKLFELQFGTRYPVCTASSAAEALEMLKTLEAGLVLSDERMPGMRGVDFLAEVHRSYPSSVRVVVSAYSDPSILLRAINLGHVHEYVVKPWNKDELEACIQRGMAMVAQRRSLVGRAELAATHDAHLDIDAEQTRRAIVGASPALLDCVELVAKAAKSDATLLLTGETGTGKELMARHLHALSARAAEPFVAVNCAALPEELLESELFGHEKGAFTGADRQRKGRFELAHHGTLFLDEIGDIPEKVQVRLLRVLQEGQFERVGGQRTRTSDVRIVAATHQDLEARVAAQRFRRDLYFRINVVRIHLPPLRERTGDVALLLAHFVRRHSRLSGRPEPSLAAGLAETLVHYDWPGNVRELENLVQRAIVLSDGHTLTLDDFRFQPRVAHAPPATTSNYESGPIPTLQADLASRPPQSPDTAAPTEAAVTPKMQAQQEEKNRLYQAILRSAGNYSRAARSLGMPRSTFIHRARRFGLI